MAQVFLMFNPPGQVPLIITGQEEGFSAVAGIKYTPPVYLLLISRHLLEVKMGLTLQVSPGYEEEKTRNQVWQLLSPSATILS